VTCGYPYVLLTRDDVGVILEDDPRSSRRRVPIVTGTDDVGSGARKSSGHEDVHRHRDRLIAKEGLSP
jgi:hypothetical protein